MTESYHVIGGGIVGSSVAYHLSRRTDAPVTVYEQGELGAETTRKSLAFFGYYGDAVQWRMKRYAMDLYNDFFADPRADPAYTLVGRLQVATSPDGAAGLREEYEALAAGRAERARPNGDGPPADASPIQYVAPEDLTVSMALPYLDTSEVEGTIYRPQVGYLRPREMAREFAARAEENGATVREHSQVEEVLTADDRVTGLVVDGETVDADEVVCAAGPWNPKVARSVGVELPVRHTLAPVLKLEPETPRQYSVPWVTHRESGFSIRRDIDGTILMTHHPVGGYDAATEYDPGDVGDTVPDDLRERGLATLERLLPAAADAEVVDEWVGVRSATPDGNPIVGWTALEGFSIAAFSTSGIQLSPATGKVIAAQLLDDNPTSYYDGLSVTRFEGYDDWRGGA